MNRIAQLDAAARAEIFAETANRVALTEALVEKDFWVCWTLAQIFTIESFRENLLFKGGTSLSKVFGLIKRFSEDIDLAVDYAMLGFTGEKHPLAPGLSRTKQTALLASMLEACREYIAGPFIDQLRQRFTERSDQPVPGAWLSIRTIQTSFVFTTLQPSPLESPILRRRSRLNWEPTPNSFRAENSAFAPSPQLSSQNSSANPTCA